MQTVANANRTRFVVVEAPEPAEAETVEQATAAVVTANPNRTRWSEVAQAA